MYSHDDGLLLVSGCLNNESNDYQGGYSGLAGVQGELGKIVAYTTRRAQQLQKASVGTLYGGLYQRVKFKAGTTASNARGQIVFWDDVDDFVVTPDAPADARDIAGVTLNAPDKGDFGIIQVAGLATCLCRSSVTDTTIGNLVFVLDDANTVDAIAIGTTATGGHVTRAIGTAVEALANDGLKLVRLRFIGLNF